MCRITLFFALPYQAGQGRFDFMQGTEAVAYLSKFGRSDGAGIRAVHAVIELHERGDLLKRETEPLCCFDEPEA